MDIDAYRNTALASPQPPPQTESKQTESKQTESSKQVLSTHPFEIAYATGALGTATVARVNRANHANFRDYVNPVFMAQIPQLVSQLMEDAEPGVLEPYERRSVINVLATLIEDGNVKVPFEEAWFPILEEFARKGHYRNICEIADEVTEIDDSNDRTPIIYTVIGLLILYNHLQCINEILQQCPNAWLMNAIQEMRGGANPMKISFFAASIGHTDAAVLLCQYIPRTMHYPSTPVDMAIKSLFPETAQAIMDSPESQFILSDPYDDAMELFEMLRRWGIKRHDEDEPLRWLNCMRMIIDNAPEAYRNPLNPTVQYSQFCTDIKRELEQAVQSIGRRFIGGLIVVDAQQLKELLDYLNEKCSPARVGGKQNKEYILKKECRSLKSKTTNKMKTKTRRNKMKTKTRRNKMKTKNTKKQNENKNLKK